MLQERFNAKPSYILEVLRYGKNGPTAERIRRSALEMGGRYVDPDFSPNCRTSYIGGMIIQSFGERVRLEICRESGNITLLKNGEVVEHQENASMDIWNSMAIKASSIAEAAMVSR